MSGDLEGLLRRADLDDLVRHVESTCAARDWEHLVAVRDGARAAVATGRQLWPVATLANYRLALWAPPRLAVRALEETARAFMPGPVSEILASRHEWGSLAPHLPAGHDRSLVAHERAIRGDSVDPGEPNHLDVPIAPCAFEPAYVPATYGDDGVTEPAPALPRPSGPRPTTPAEALEDAETVAAFRQHCDAWTSQSNGTARCTVTEGDALAALGAAGHPEVSLAGVTTGEALALLAWAGASGGAHGRRRGLASGRAGAWWFLAAFTGLAHRWPAEEAHFAGVLGSLRFSVWDAPGTDSSGWCVRLVVEDPDEGVACALEARDSVSGP